MGNGKSKSSIKHKSAISMQFPDQHRAFSLRGIAGAAAAGLILIFGTGAACNVAGLSDGLTGEGNPFLPGNSEPFVEVSPTEQDIADTDYAVLLATTANLPEASTDNDGIHAAPLLRWKVLSGGGTLETVDRSATTLENNTTLDSDPTGEFGSAAIYFPDAGASGAAVVQCEVIRPTNRTVIDEFGEAQQEMEDIVVATSRATIHVNDSGRLKLTPSATTLPAGGVLSLKAILEAEISDGIDEATNDEDAEPSELVYEWNMTGLAGAGELQSATDSDTARFTAFTEAATFTISVKTRETTPDGRVIVNGPAHAVVKVDPKLRTVNTFGYYLSKDDETAAGSYYVVAYVYFPKIEGAINYTVVAQGMHDEAYYGEGYTWNFSVVNGQIYGGATDDGGAYKVGLSSATGSTLGDNLSNAFAWMESRFSGMRVIVTATVQD
jgi:hypothetical protein